MLKNMTTTELIAFWGTFVLTICGFISWFTIDEKSEKPPEATPDSNLTERDATRRKKAKAQPKPPLLGELSGTLSPPNAYLTCRTTDGTR
jgi:hypothetical protein